MKIYKFARVLIILNIVVLIIRLFGEVRIYNIEHLFQFGVDYYIMSGTFASIAIVSLLPLVIRSARKNKINDSHIRLLYGLISLVIFSVIWQVVYVLRISDPLGIYTIYVVNEYIVALVNIIYLVAIIRAYNYLILEQEK